MAKGGLCYLSSWDAGSLVHALEGTVCVSCALALLLSLSVSLMHPLSSHARLLHCLLCVPRSYKDGQQFIAQQAPNMASRTQWREWCSAKERPDNIPSAPDVHYKDRGWEGWVAWLGVDPSASSNGRSASSIDFFADDYKAPRSDMEVQEEDGRWRPVQVYTHRPVSLWQRALDNGPLTTRPEQRALYVFLVQLSALSQPGSCLDSSSKTWQYTHRRLWFGLTHVRLWFGASHQAQQQRGAGFRGGGV